MAEIIGKLIAEEIIPSENHKNLLIRCRIILDNVVDQVTLTQGTQEDRHLVSLKDETVVLSVPPARAFSLAVSVLTILGELLHYQKNLKNLLQNQDQTL